MRHFDLSPLYRSTVGFDHLFSMLDSLGRTNGNGQATYPPYDIERTGENEYRIVMAVAGFAESDLSIEVKEQTLTVRGEKSAEEQPEGEVLYRGIAQRGFERRFQLADHVQVQGARLENGLLSIELKRELPEAMKPRTIEIGSPTKHGKVIDQKAA